ncbi:Snf7 domain containing protein [Naviculisporaceae sp. PSN 640]
MPWSMAGQRNCQAQAHAPLLRHRNLGFHFHNWILRTSTSATSRTNKLIHTLLATLKPQACFQTNHSPPTNPPNTTKMNRLFGTSTSKSTPKPTLNSAITNLDTRISSIDVKLASLNAELTGYQTKLSKMRDGPGKTALKQKALKVLQRRKQYEAQRDQLESQVWNMEQAQTMQDNLKNTMVTVDALKQTNKALKKEYGKVDIDRIERLQDEMADLLDVGNEIQESLARSYDIPEDVDEAELDAELEALGQEVELERELGMSEGALPSFMQDEVPEFIDEAPSTAGKVKEAAGAGI